MDLPQIVVLSHKDESLGSFLEKQGFNVLRFYNIESLKKKILKDNIAVILIEKDGELLDASLHKFLTDVSNDTKIIIFGRDPKGLDPYWRYKFLKWPSNKKSAISQMIKNSLLEYMLFRRERLFIEASIFYNKEVSVEDDEHKDSNDTLEVLRSFNIELTSCRDAKKAIKVTRVYIDKMFEPHCLCLMVRLDKHIETFVFNKAYEKKLLKKILATLFVFNRIFMRRSMKKEEIKSVYINGEKSGIDFEIELDELSDLIQQDTGDHIIFPIMAGGENFGCMAIYSKERTAFNKDDLRKFSFMAYQLASALFGIKLISSIRDISIKDGLTGLYNRRYFDEILQHEYMRAKRYYFPLTLIIIDIDYFKSVNDTYGHLIGDKVLKELAKLIKRSVRQVDIVARFGGEEFTILLLNTPMEEAANMAERLRNIVQRHEISAEGYRINITISAGIASLRKDTCSKDDLVDQADRALLKAKASGRNKVYMYISEDEIKEVKTKGPRERRRYKRIATELSIDYIPLTIHCINPGRAVSKDISEAGISFKDIQEIPEGEFLLLDFDIPVGPEESHHIKALGQVVWNKKEGKNVIMGAKLITLNPEDSAILRSACIHNKMLN